MTDEPPPASDDVIGAGPTKDSIRDVERLAAQLRGRLPISLSGRSLSEMTKVPYKAALLDSGLSYRAAELAEGTLELIHSRRMIGAILTARAVVETAALHYYAVKKVVQSLETGSIVESDDILYRALVGSPFYGDGEVKPIQVLTAIDHVDKKFPGYRSVYDEQSEFAHPNWFGANGAYAGANETEDRVEFLPDFGSGPTAQEVSRGLSVGLVVLDYSHARLMKAMPEFVSLCERVVLDQGT